MFNLGYLAARNHLWLKRYLDLLLESHDLMWIDSLAGHQCISGNSFHGRSFDQVGFPGDPLDLFGGVVGYHDRRIEAHIEAVQSRAFLCTPPIIVICVARRRGYQFITFVACRARILCPGE